MCVFVQESSSRLLALCLGGTLSQSRTTPTHNTFTARAHCNTRSRLDRASSTILMTCPSIVRSKSVARAGAGAEAVKATSTPDSRSILFGCARLPHLRPPLCLRHQSRRLKPWRLEAPRAGCWVVPSLCDDACIALFFVRAGLRMSMSATLRTPLFSVNP